MTLLGGESLLNDATALTAYKVALAAAIGTATGWRDGLLTFALAAAGGVVVGIALGSTCRSSAGISTIRSSRAPWAWWRRSSSIWPPNRSTVRAWSRWRSRR
jgi:NhaP-type Na+/H+ or K+/H+ antiporter